MYKFYIEIPVHQNSLFIIEQFIRLEIWFVEFSERFVCKVYPIRL